MKNKRVMTPIHFVAFAEAIFSERRSAIKALDACDTQGARFHLENMEQMLSSALDSFRAEKETLNDVSTKAAKLILSNDLPNEAAQLMRHPLNSEFIASAAKTIAKAFE